MRPKRPMALPKISMMRILTNSAGLAASARAAPEPEISEVKNIHLTTKTHKKLPSKSQALTNNANSNTASQVD